MLIEGRETTIQLGEKEYHCALDVTMDFVGGKWKSVVLWYLKNQPKRFSELNRHIPGITEKMLSLQLRELEKDGIVHRTIFPEVPPRVEYRLTEFGRTLIPLLNEMAEWGRNLAQAQGKMVEKNS